VIDVAGVEVHADVVAGLEEIGEGAGPASEVERARGGAEVQLAADGGADGLEVVLEDPAQEDEEDGVIRDLLNEGGEETHYSKFRA
jgi:hypothetical protein